MNFILLLSLAITGGLVLLAAIVAYNAWILTATLPKKPCPDRPPAPSQAIPAEPTLRQEPSLDASLGPSNIAASYANLGRITARTHGESGDALRMPVPTHSLERRPGCTADRCDRVHPAEGLVSGDAALAALPPTRRAGSRPCH